MKKIRKSFWRAYWKLHDKKKMLVARLKGYLDGLPPKTRRRIVLAPKTRFIRNFEFATRDAELRSRIYRIFLKDFIPVQPA